MTPPTAPRLDPLKVIFIDISAGIAEEESFTPETHYPEFLGLLCRLSGRVADSIPRLPEPRAFGQGLTLSDGPWWYRLAKRVASDDASGNDIVQKGPWILLESLYAYDHLIGQMTLGTGTQGGWIEVQHVRYDGLNFPLVSLR